MHVNKKASPHVKMVMPFALYINWQLVLEIKFTCSLSKIFAL
jgi:hypothetical protein